MYIYIVLAIVLLIVVSSVMVPELIDNKSNTINNKDPAICMEEVLEDLQKSNFNRLENAILSRNLSQVYYDNPIREIDDFNSLLNTPMNLSYELMTNHNDDILKYYILRNDRPVAIVELEKIGILEKLDTFNWSIKCIHPVVDITELNYSIILPRDYELFVNGYKMEDSIKINEYEVSYKLDTLYSMPDIEIYDEYCIEADYVINDNIITPIINEFKFSTPNTYSVFLNGIAISGKTNEDLIDYNIKTAASFVDVYDTLGNHVVYDGSSSIVRDSIYIAIPTNYVLEIQDLVVGDYFTEFREINEYSNFTDIVSMPKQKCYDLKNFIVRPDIKIFDNNGDQVEFMEDKNINIITQRGSTEMPAVFLENDFNPFELVKIWSLFISRYTDKECKEYLDVIKHLIKGSYIYDIVDSWNIRSQEICKDVVDISFQDENITNYVDYNNGVYSFDAHFIKMSTYSNGLTTIENVNNRFYITNLFGNEWVILDVQEIADLR